jgi:hypothetical protein
MFWWTKVRGQSFLGFLLALAVGSHSVAPMHAALCPLEGYLRTHGAPHLESLRPMQCDA